MIILGIDDGNFSCKSFGRVRGEEIGFTVPSLVRKGIVTSRSVVENSAVVDADTSSITSTFLIDGEAYSTGDVKSDSKRADNRNYSNSNENVAVVHNILHQLGLAGQDVSVMTGMPFQYYYKPNGEINQAFIDKKKKAFATSVVNAKDDSVVTIAKHAVMAQGEAAYYDLLIDIQNERTSKGMSTYGVTNREIANSNVLILDIGGGTTDPVYVKRGATIDHQRSGTFEHGGYKIISELEDLVKVELGLSVELGRTRYQDALLTGHLQINTKRKVDVSELVNPLLEKHFEIIMEKTKAVVNGFDDIDIIAPIGGTTEFFRSLFEKNIVDNELRFVDEPIFANPRGMYKRMFLANAGKKK
ncbi:hypothetical protein BM526_20095 (plasmid) [Alteromonas mediterranea]|uniref:ParM/StbA family protein n=1 Tax=Alteromonas mediterranea TaxID=314275 RepID=UPI000903500A|nr:ParM/StbA family protein [Alteromonas mediterranea]APE04275.1 hypothetical protein BM526_20095 [Alteromonas mediterranea]